MKKRKSIIYSFLFALLFCSVITYAAETPRIVTITKLEGSVLIQAKGKAIALPARTGMELKAGDRIITGKDGKVEISFDDGSITRVAPNSRIDFEKLSQDETQGTTTTVINTNWGKIWNKVQHLINKNSRFEVNTPSAVAGVRGTEYAVHVERLNTQVRVYRGKVGVKSQKNNAGNETLVDPHMQAEVTEEGALTQQADSLDVMAVDEWEKDNLVEDVLTSYVIVETEVKTIQLAKMEGKIQEDRVELAKLAKELEVLKKLKAEEIDETKQEELKKLETQIKNELILKRDILCEAEKEKNNLSQEKQRLSTLKEKIEQVPPDIKPEELDKEIKEEVKVVRQEEKAKTLERQESQQKIIEKEEAANEIRQDIEKKAEELEVKENLDEAQELITPELIQQITAVQTQEEFEKFFVESFGEGYTEIITAPSQELLEEAFAPVLEENLDSTSGTITDRKSGSSSKDSKEETLPEEPEQNPDLETGAETGAGSEEEILPEEPEQNPEELTEVHINGAYWGGDNEIPEWLAPDIHSDQFIITIEEWIEEQDHTQLDELKEKAGQEFILKAEGYDDVNVICYGGNFSEGDGKFQGYWMDFTQEELNKMVPGVNYNIGPVNISEVYKWAVLDGITISRPIPAYELDNTATFTGTTYTAAENKLALTGLSGITPDSSFDPTKLTYSDAETSAQNYTITSEYESVTDAVYLTAGKYYYDSIDSIDSNLSIVLTDDDASTIEGLTGFAYKGSVTDTITAQSGWNTTAEGIPSSTISEINVLNSLAVFNDTPGLNEYEIIGLGKLHTDNEFDVYFKAVENNVSLNQITDVSISWDAVDAGDNPVPAPTVVDYGNNSDGVLKVTVNPSIIASGDYVLTIKNHDGSIILGELYLEIIESPPTVTFTPTDGLTNVAVDSDITLSFSEAVRKSDNSDITTADLAALITLKETDENGTDVAFTSTINAEKTLITVIPDADLKNDQVYYVAIDATVEDNTDQSLTGSTSATFTTTEERVSIVPPLSSASQDGYSISATTYYDTYYPWKLFDDNVNTGWNSGWDNNGEVTIELPSPAWVYEYSLCAYYEGAPANWIFQGSNDGVSWEIIDTESGHDSDSWGGTTPTTNYFTVDNPQNFKLYKIVIDDAAWDDPSWIYITGMELFVDNDVTVAIVEATAAVEAAEVSRLQADVDAAQILVNDLPAGTDKDALQARLDAIVIVDMVNILFEKAPTTISEVAGESNMTDGDEDTCAIFQSDGTVTWELGGKYTVTGYSLKGDGKIQIVDDSGKILKWLVGTANGALEDITPELKNVKKIIMDANSVTNSVYANVYELDIRGYLTDDLPPLTPTDLTAVGSDGTVVLTWTKKEEIDIAGYNVYRDGDEEPINAALITGGTYTITGLSNGTTYSYTVTSVDTAGNESPHTSAVSAIPAVYISLLKGKLPTTISGVVTDAFKMTDGDGETHVVLPPKSRITWDLGGTYTVNGYFFKGGGVLQLLDENGVTLEWNLSSTNGSLVDIVDITPEIEGVKKVEVYTSMLGAKVYELDIRGSLTNNLAPSTPTGLTGVGSDGTVELSWITTEEIDRAGYNVYQDGEKVNMSLITGGAYTVTGLNNGETYSYSITSVDTAGNESPQTSEVLVTPNAN